MRGSSLLRPPKRGASQVTTEAFFTWPALLCDGYLYNINGSPSHQYAGRLRTATINAFVVLKKKQSLRRRYKSVTRPFLRPNVHGSRMSGSYLLFFTVEEVAEFACHELDCLVVRDHICGEEQGTAADRQAYMSATPIRSSKTSSTTRYHSIIGYPYMT